MAAKAPKRLLDALEKQIKEETDKFWENGYYGKNPRDVKYNTVQSLTQAQCDALATFSAECGPHQRIEVVQTYTETGGTHVYARLPHKAGHEVHIARSGSIMSLG